MQGLSAKKLTTDCAVSVIIFLYLIDNDTSWMILMSSGIGHKYVRNTLTRKLTFNLECTGTMIEVWKVLKAINVEVDWSNTYFVLGFPIRCPFMLSYCKSYTETETRIYDNQAMYYVSYVLYPLIVGYASYSLVHISHKSWYSWVLASLTGAVYTFGFVMMTPQLFINYKLKSVAHLPWRVMVYKFLNTFIDDLFAFIIEMPTMHRLACFRDDLVFFIYIYQRHIYEVDLRRISEHTDELWEWEPPEHLSLEGAYNDTQDSD